MNIKQLDFVKSKDNKTDLNDRTNVDKLMKWVIPIIEKNEGWGTGELTREAFLKNPESFQDEIDATVWGNVHILIDDEGPAGLLEFSKTTIIDESKKRHKLLVKLLDGEGLDELERVVGKELGDIKLEDIKAFLTGKNIYTSIGLVLRSDLQGQKTGYSEKLYEIIADGINVGWTSSPIIVRQRRKLFSNTLFFPAFGEFPNTVAEWAICLYIYVGRLNPSGDDKVEGYKFGTMSSSYFVEDRGEEYLEIAKKMRSEGKITELDERRIQYVLSKKSCAGAIVSWN